MPGRRGGGGGGAPAPEPQPSTPGYFPGGAPLPELPEGAEPRPGYAPQPPEIIVGKATALPKAKLPKADAGPGYLTPLPDIFETVQNVGRRPSDVILEKLCEIYGPRMGSDVLHVRDQWIAHLYKELQRVTRLLSQVLNLEEEMSRRVASREDSLRQKDAELRQAKEALAAKDDELRRKDAELKELQAKLSAAAGD